MGVACVIFWNGKSSLTVIHVHVHLVYRLTEWQVVMHVHLMYRLTEWQVVMHMHLMYRLTEWQVVMHVHLMYRLTEWQVVMHVHLVYRLTEWRDLSCNIMFICYFLTLYLFVFRISIKTFFCPFYFHKRNTS